MTGEDASPAASACRTGPTVSREDGCYRRGEACEHLSTCHRTPGVHGQLPAMSLHRIHGRKPPVRRHHRTARDFSRPENAPHLLKEACYQCRSVPRAHRPASSSAAAGQVLAQVRHRRGAGDQKDVGRAAKQPGERDLHRRGAEARSDLGQGGRLQRVEPAEREERHIGDAVAAKIVDQGIVGAMRQIVRGSARRRSRKSGALPRSAQA